MLSEDELAVLERQAQRTVAQYAGLAVGDMPGYCWEAPDDVLRLIAEVRRLRQVLRDASILLERLGAES